jgi:hypothetical protein
VANEKHLLLTAIGDYTDAGLVNETWQVGIRLALVFGGVDPIGTLPNNWEPVPETQLVTDGDVTYSSNWTINGPLVVDFDPVSWLTDYAVPSFEAWMPQPGISDSCRLRALRVAPIGRDGRIVPAPPYASGTPAQAAWDSNYPLGNDGADLLPLQVAAVLSHRTGQVGSVGRGRMFRPGLSKNATTADARLSSTALAALLPAQVDLLEGLAYSGGEDVTVVPIVTGSGYLNYATITTVRIGDVADTQRRRRRSLVEAYTSASVSYGA